MERAVPLSVQCIQYVVLRRSTNHSSRRAKFTSLNSKNVGRLSVASNRRCIMACYVHTVEDLTPTACNGAMMFATTEH